MKEDIPDFLNDQNNDSSMTSLKKENPKWLKMMKNN